MSWKREEKLAQLYVKEQEKILELYMNIPKAIYAEISKFYVIPLYRFGEHSNEYFKIFL